MGDPNRGLGCLLFVLWIILLIKLLISILIPPLGAYWDVGFSKHFWLSVLLTCCGYVPGVVHIIWLMFITKPIPT